MKRFRTGNSRILEWLLLWLAVASLGSMLAQAQSPAVTDLLRRTFAGTDFRVKTFGPAHWFKGGASYTTLEPSPQEGAFDLVRYDTATGTREVLLSASQLVPPGVDKPLVIEDYSWSPDTNRVLIFTDSRRLWRQNTRGDYWLLDRKSGALRKLGGGGGPPGSTMFATFSPDGSKVAFVRFNNIFVEDIESGETSRVTSDGSEKIVNGTSDWVYEEEFSIRDAFRWSPDSQHIAYWQFDTSKVKNYPLVYDSGAPYRIETGIPYPGIGVYPSVRQVPYPQPGSENSSVRVGVVPAIGGETKWMDVPGYANTNYIARMEWAGDSELLLEHLNRLQNTNDVLLADIRTGAVRMLYQDKDPAWVDVVDDMKWIHGGKDLLWLSEHDGWRHAYLISRDGGQVRPVTSGPCDVIEVVGVDPREEWLYYVASPDNATERYLYRTRLDGKGSPERVSPANQPGTHSYEVTPDLHWAIHTHSTFDTPPVTDLVELPSHRVQRTLEDNARLRSNVKDLTLTPAEFLRLDIGKGVTLDGWLIKPKGFDPQKKYPILIYVYGEPAAQTVLDRWDAWHGVFHRALAQDGYLIASFDNRGTPAPKGRAWRKVVYGSVGVLSSEEQALAIHALEQAHPFVDASRVAVWGRSGGGSNTLNLMFRHPEIYKVGMSVAPVPDQRLYDSIYQERYMGLPQDNPEGYKAGSSINFADGLQGKLLLVHGSDDDNVHYQGTELLVNRLIELGKPFDFMTYPGRTHAITEGKGTAYHLYSLLARYLEEHLPPGPSPQ